MEYTTSKIKELITEKLDKYFATTPKGATPMQIYKACALVLRDMLLLQKQRFNREAYKQGAKRVY